MEYQEFRTGSPVILRVADKREHYPVGQGFVHVPRSDKKGFVRVRCFYMPTLPVTILSPARIAKQLGYDGYNASAWLNGEGCSITLKHKKTTSRDLSMSVELRRGLLYTQPLIPVMDQDALMSDDALVSATAESIIKDELSDYRACREIMQMSEKKLRILWHQRLGHMHSRRVAEMHKHADGIPRVPEADEVEKCPVCIQAKLHHANRSKDDARRALVPFQGIAIDFGFMVQRSKDKTRVSELAGLNGETCYCMITDHKSGAIFTEAFSSKAPPLDFINRWLLKYGLPKEMKGKYVRMDRGGELAQCPDVVKLFEDAGYSVEDTANQSSHMNGSGERPHRTIGDAVRAMLTGAGLEYKYWPYALQHYTRLYNVTPHRGKEGTPYFIIHGKKPNLRALRTFGCRVYSVPCEKRKAKLVNHSKACIFLGYSQSFKKVLCYDPRTNQIGTAQHVGFDEAMSDADDKPLNAKLLDLDEPVDEGTFSVEDDPPDLHVSESPFCETEIVRINLDWGQDNPLGFAVSSCDKLLRAYISELWRPAQGYTKKQFRSKFFGSYVIAMDGKPTFSIEDVDEAVNALRDLEQRPSSMEVELAPERRMKIRGGSSPLHLRMQDIRHVTALQHVSDDGLTSKAYTSALEDFERELENVDVRSIESLSASCEGQGDDPHLFAQLEALLDANADEGLLICRVQVDEMTDEERELTNFSRGRLKRLANWDDWDAAFDKQLDAHHESGVFGEPILRSSIPEDLRRNILRIQWSNIVKVGGKRKARACLDGSKRAAPWLRKGVQTYASTIDLACMRLFFAIAAAESYYIHVGDTKNAFQQSPPPTVQCYVEIDDAYASWYKK